MEKIKNLLPFILIVFLLAGGYYYRDIQKKKDIQEKEVNSAEDLSKEDMLIKELNDKYQPNINWEENNNYTIQIQDKLLNNKPTLFKVFLNDIERKNDKINFKFDSSYYLGDDDYILELECNNDNLDKFQKVLMSSIDKEDFNYYLVIADVTNVRRPIFSLNSVDLGENESEINVETSHILLIKGSCLDIIQVPNENN